MLLLGGCYGTFSLAGRYPYTFTVARSHLFITSSAGSFWLGQLQRWKSLFETTVLSVFFVYILRTFASVIFIFFCFEGTLACLDVFFTCTYLFLSMELQLQLEAIERKRVFTALVTTFVILQFASSPFESCGGIGASILRYICRYVQLVHLQLCSFASS